MGRKRKSSSLIPNHKGRVPPCRICEAPGTGFHYGVNTCEACKGFFHRSIGQHIHYRCEKENNCVIHFQTVKFCQKCRYAKCLAFGMSKTASKTGRYPSCKRTEDILELKRLEKEHAKSVNADTDPISKVRIVSDSEPSLAKRPCSQLQTDVDAFPDSTNPSPLYTTSGTKDPNSIPSPTWNFSPQSDCSTQHSSSTTSSPINLSLTSYDSIPGNRMSPPALSSPTSIRNNSRSPWDTSSSSEISSLLSSYQVPPHKGSHDWLKTDSSGSPDSNLNCPYTHSSPSLSPLPHNNSTCKNKNTPTYIPSYTPPSSGPHDTLSAHPTSCSVCPGNQSPSPSSFPWSHTPLPECPYQVQGIPQAASSARPGLSLGELTELVPVPASSQDVEANVKLPDLKALNVIDDSTAEIIKKLDEIYADSDSVVKTLLEVERQTLRHDARDLSPTEILTEQLKHKETCLTRVEIFGRKTFLAESEYENVRRETGLDVDGRQMLVSHKFKCLEKIIMNLAIFAKAVPGFTYIPLHQMVRLIKYARWDISVLSSINLSNSNLMVSMSRSHGWVCPLDFDETSAKSFVAPSIRLMGRLQKDKLTDEEVVVTIGIALVSPDRTEPTDSPLIQCIHSHLVNILLKLLKQNHKEPMRVFARIVSVLTEIRTMEMEASTSYMKDLQSVMSTEIVRRPIVQEMMTGICFQQE